MWSVRTSPRSFSCRQRASLAAVAAAALLFSGGCATSRSDARSRIAATVTRVSADAPLRHALWGIVVEDENGRVLFEQNARKLMIPASNRKVFSAVTAAECIGLETRLGTELLLAGEDLVLRGDGDPSFGSRRRESPGFEPMVAALAARGVTRVRDIVADVSRFDRVILPGSWKLGNLPYDYSAPVDAIAYGENVAAGRSVPEPGLHAAERLRDALILGGIRVEGKLRLDPEGSTCRAASCERVALVESPPLFELLATVLKNSHNLYAEMLHKRSSSGSYAAAQEVERRFATLEAGVPSGEFHFADGSGLSPEDLVAPAAMTRMYRWMNHPSRRGVWWLLLAQPGGEGTLRNRLPWLSARFRGKTGTIHGVNALSGIVAGERGGFRYFAIILNHHLAGSSAANKAIDEIVREIARF